MSSYLLNCIYIVHLSTKEHLIMFFFGNELSGFEHEKQLKICKVEKINFVVTKVSWDK